MYKLIFKRLLDIIISILFIIILSPLIFLTTILLFFANKGYPFFRQSRPGKNERIFRIIKFKTMSDRKNQYGQLLPDHLRITSIGKIIRKLSIDEIPQLFNVLVGHMSIIGPRPLLTEYLPLYNEYQKKRHLVKPGITGWAQVNGRNTLSWEQKFNYDVYYVDNFSFKLDIEIFVITLRKVFKREGINQSLNLTMEKFKGNE